MATNNWVGGSGDWGTASLWSAGTIANAATTTADITAAGTYTVSIGGGETFAIGQGTLDNANATPAGRLQRRRPEPVRRRVSTSRRAPWPWPALWRAARSTWPGGTLFALGGTLADMTVIGPLAVTVPYAVLTLADGTSVRGTVAGQQGTIAVTGAGIGFADATAALTDTLLELGSATGNYYYGQLRLDGALQVGTQSTLEVLGDHTDITVSDPSDQFGDAIVNTGVFALAGTGDIFGGQLAAFDNSGTVILGASDTLDLTLTAADGSLLPSASFANTGTIVLGAGAVLAIDGNIDAAALGTIQNNGGTLALSGSFDNTGHTLTSSPGGAFADVGARRHVRRWRDRSGRRRAGVCRRHPGRRRRRLRHPDRGGPDSC